MVFSAQQMSDWLIPLFGWAAIAGFFAFHFWLVRKAQARDPRTRGEFQNPGDYVD